VFISRVADLVTQGTEAIGQTNRGNAAVMSQKEVQGGFLLEALFAHAPMLSSA
jgi:hypothetical protein